jgi:hypothetical protein
MKVGKISFLDFFGNLLGRVTPELGDLGCHNFLATHPVTLKYRNLCPYLAQYGHMRKKCGQMGYPRKEHQKCGSGMLTSGP